MNFPESVTGVDERTNSDQSTLCLMDSEFDKLVETLLDAHHVPGLSIAIIRNGRTQCKVCWHCSHEYVV